jgi:hypothetical protein
MDLPQSPARLKITAHVVGWMIFFFLPLLLSPGRDVAIYFSEPKIFISLVLRNLVLAALFYVNFFYITPRFFKIESQGKFLVIIATLIFITGSFNFFLHEWLTNSGINPGRPPGPPPEIGHDGGLRPHGPPRRLMLASPYFSSVLIAALVTGASSLLVLWNNWLQAKANEQERNLQKVAAELSVLKLQISPHFLFNTLNNIRWLVRSKSDKAEAAVVKLAQLLRYILYQTNQEQVSLEKELEHLQDYINLEQMRLERPELVEVTLTGDVTNKSIVPLLLIPAVENFFKHADLNSSKGEIRIVVEGNRFKLKTNNRILKKAEDTVSHESGIGLTNLRKRLSLHYPEKHQLQFGEDDGNFYFLLTIDLSSSL